jgi:serine/threonine-protein kinase
MRSLLRIGLVLCLFLTVAGAVGYLTLKLIVRSEDVVVVPDLVGKDVVYAAEMLTDLGLNIKVGGFEYSSDIAKNHVAFQEPGAGAEVKKDRGVRIIVSKGPQIVMVPNLVGMDVRQANIIMEQNGLSPGAVSRTFSDVAARGELISQSPMPGSMVVREDSIDMLISLGRRPVTVKMPYLDGLTPEDAILILERFRLVLGQMRSVQQNDLAQDVVVEQDPPSGYPVASGSLVNLTINTAEKGVILDKGLYLFHYRVSEGFLKEHIRLRINAFGMLYDLYDIFQGPGEDIWMIVPQDPEVTFFLYQDGELTLSHSFVLGSRAHCLSELETGLLRW